jgi:hypothetical protein
LVVKVSLPVSRLVAVAAASVLPVWASAAVVFSDNFDQGASNAWGNEMGQWRSVDGTYDAKLPNNSPPTYSSVTTLPALTDFTVDVDVNNWDDGGVWLRSAISGQSISGVLLVTGGDGGTYDGLYWHTATNGNYSGAMGHLALPGVQGSNQHLTITVQGNDYTACVGQSCSTLTTSLFGSGSVALYDFSPRPSGDDFPPRGQNFDNVQISAVPEPGTWVLLLAGLPVVSRRLRRTAA